METTTIASSSSSSSPVVVLMVPFLAQSHLNYLLQFAHIISSYKIPTHYITSTLHNSQIKSRAPNPLHQLTQIQFHPYPLQFPPPTSSKTKFPNTLIPCFEALTQLHKPVSNLLHSLSQSTKRLVVIHDVLMTSVVKDVVNIPNGEAYSVNCGSLFSFFTYKCVSLMGQNDIVLPIKHIPSWVSCFPTVVIEFINKQLQELNFQAGDIFNSCRIIEGIFLQRLVNEIGLDKKMWAIGPLHKMTTISSKEIKDQDKWLFEWLEKQEPNSVLYVSFGTLTDFSEEEINEIAVGLELSDVKFIWALREADKVDDDSESIPRNNGEINTQSLLASPKSRPCNNLSTHEEESWRSLLPGGFEERIKGMGIVVREWVPQVEILRHKSIGGFMSHCGWNSCMESISFGVPIAAWPMHSDQPINALFLTEVLKVGVAVMEWEQRDELVSSVMISKAVKTLMASDEGCEIRKRTVELGDKVRKSTDEGGVTRMEWDFFIAHITR
uniref:Glycosyltransferase n=1 Tax=Cannabis sativa TaxID=3483 RepID=A0A803R3A0_CANSA